MNAQERPETFRTIHKAIRKALFNTAYQAGYTDFTSPGDVASLLTLFGELAYFLQQHAYNEDMYYLPMLEEKCPGVAAHDAVEHEKMERMLNDLQTQLTEVINSPDRLKNHLGYAFYLSLNRFVALYLAHMDQEETNTAAKAYALCTDEELSDMHRQIVANTPPADAAITYRYMLPSLNLSERHALLAEMKSTAPRSVLTRMLNIAEKVLSPARYQQAISFLGLSAKVEKFSFDGLGLNRSTSVADALPVN